MRAILLVIGLLIVIVSPISAQKDARSGRVMPAGDPNLDPSWDWTVTVPGQGHVMYYSPPGGPIASVSVQSPFRKNGETFFVYDDALADMYKEDGWMLVYRDFGTLSSAPSLPFFAIYNKYRGLLRVFVYNTPGFRDSFYDMKLMFREASPKPAIMTLSSQDPSKRFLDNFDSNGVLHYIGVTTPGGWYFGEFNIAGFDPMIQSNTVFRIELDGVNSSKIQLSGSLVAQGNITLEGVIRGTGNLSGYLERSSSGIPLLNKGEKYLTSVGKFTDMMEKVKIKKSNGELIKATAAIPKVGTGVKLLGTIVNVLNTFIGGNVKNFSREPISLNLDLRQDASFRGDIDIEGTLNLSGTIETSLPVWRADFAMSRANSVQELYKPVQEIPWGVFNFKSKVARGSYRDFYEGYVEPSACDWDCTCGYTWDEFGYFHYCACPEEYICDIPGYTPRYVEYSLTTTILYNTNLPISVIGAKLVNTRLLREFDLTSQVVRPGEIEFSTPLIQEESPFDPYTYTYYEYDFLTKWYLVLFTKINSPVRNSDDEIVFIQSVNFESFNPNPSPGRQVQQSSNDRGSAIPEKGDNYYVYANYPNPFENRTLIKYTVEKAAFVQITVFDGNGRMIRQVDQGFRGPGLHSTIWNGADFDGNTCSPGLYLCHIQVDDKIEVVKIMKR